MPDNVAETSLEWALEHILRFGDTDILPTPFEYEAIAADRQQVIDTLSKVDLTGYSARSNQIFLVPKPGTGFRVVQQLDPLDTILYAGAVHEISSQIESSRVAKELRIACSFRLDIDESGRFFGEDSGWRDFQEHSADLAADSTHVVVADIADFYNQVYQHRVESALDGASVNPTRAKNIESFLAQLTAQQSRGLPVGPYASIVLAEACLNDVDQHLLSKGFSHTRYVDDFRIFADSKKECLRALHELTEYLYTAHRLCLQSSKTEIMSADTFIKKELKDPEHVEQQNKLNRLQDMIVDFLNATGYTAELDDIPEDDVNAVVRDVLAEMFEELVTSQPLRIGPARYVLRRARSLRTREIYSTLLKHLECLVPVFRDVARYLIATMPKKQKYVRPVAKGLFRLADSDFGQFAFVRMWLFDILQSHPHIVEDSADIASLAEADRSLLGVRPRALWARAMRDTAWVRGMKEKWRGVGPWDQRAILWSGSILPKKERQAWLGPLKTHDDPLIRAVSLAACNG